MTYHIIYRTTNIITGNFYIGVHSTKNLDDGYLGSGRVLKRHIRKHGKHNFIKELMFLCETRESAFEKEKEFLKILKDHELCLNLHSGGTGVEFGTKIDEDTKKLISERKIKFYDTEEGKIAKAKISESVKKVFAEKGDSYWSPEARANMKNIHPPFKRTGPRSLEARAKQSATTMGRKKGPMPEETKKSFQRQRLEKILEKITP